MSEATEVAMPRIELADSEPPIRQRVAMRTTTERQALRSIVQTGMGKGPASSRPCSISRPDLFQYVGHPG